MQLLYLPFMSIKITWTKDGLVAKGIKEDGEKKNLLNEANVTSS